MHLADLDPAALRSFTTIPQSSISNATMSRATLDPARAVLRAPRAARCSRDLEIAGRADADNSAVLGARGTSIRPSHRPEITLAIYLTNFLRFDLKT